MRNRERYVEGRNAYDLMITMREQGIDVCPIKLVGAEMPRCIPTEDYKLIRIDAKPSNEEEKR